MPDGRWSATASSVYAAYTPAKMIDGITTTFFHTNEGIRALQWVQIDLGETVLVSSK